MTELNQKILDLLRESNGHLTAEEMFFLARSEKVNISLASVYRILTSLSENGEIQRLSIPGHSDVFDKTINEHAHMVCLKCGKVKDVDVKDIRSILKKSIKEKFTSFNLTINYVCKDCKKKGDA